MNSVVVKENKEKTKLWTILTKWTQKNIITQHIVCSTQKNNESLMTEHGVLNFFILK